MSEYKYACPVCGQHMMCDSSQAGSVMECPTCFQKITAPQAPAAGDNQKFVLTGTKVGERPLPKIATETPVIAPPIKSFPWVIVMVVLVVGLAGAAVFFLRGKNSPSVSPPPVAAATNVTPPPKPALIAPVADDANWTLTLGTNAIPDAPVAGRIHGQDFIIERASYQTNGLTLRHGIKGPTEFGVVINFGGSPPEALAGKSINVNPDAEKAVAISLRWKDDSGAQRKKFDAGYALRLDFGDMAKGRLPGKIYLCLPDAEKSYLLGTFSATIVRPKPKK